MAKIIIIGPDGRHERTLPSRLTVGRHPANDLQILDRIMSKEHCHILRREDGRFFVEDQGSLNGTYVNDQRITTHLLSDGDQIKLGETRIVFADHTSSQGAGFAATGPMSAQQRPLFNQVGLPQSPAASGAQPLPASPLTARQPFGAPPSAAVPPSAGIPSATDLTQGRVPPAARAPSPATQTRVTLSTNTVESHIRSKLAPLLEQSFLPAKLVRDEETLRRDYEKLRASYELTQSIGVELDVDRLLDKILDAAFDLLQADRGVILLYDDDGELIPKKVRTVQNQPEAEVVLSTTIVEEVLRDKAAVLSNDASVDSRFSGAHSVIMQGIRSSMAVPLLHAAEVFGVMILDSQIAANAFTEKDLQLFQNVANQAAIAIQNSLFARKLEAEAITRERFQRLLSPAIAEQVIKGEVEVKKGGELRETTVLFSDIRGFTSLSESIQAQEVVDMLNHYFELMVDIIFDNEGTLDKFVGDEIMALFGAPVAHVDDPIRAVRTALTMLSVLDTEFNATRRSQGLPELQIGIGINTGEVVAGYLGSSKALEYTVIGDTVNTGARLCSVAKAGQCLISEETYQRVKNHFEIEALPDVRVKGKAKALTIYSVIRPLP